MSVLHYRPSNDSDCVERAVHFQRHFPKSSSMGGPLISRTLRETNQGLLVRSLLKMTRCRDDLTEGRVQLSSKMFDGHRGSQVSNEKGPSKKIGVLLCARIRCFVKPQS